MAKQPDLDLATLRILLQRLRRHPHDLALRVRAAEHVAILADHSIAPADGPDKLLSDAITGARLLRRALERTNKATLVNGTDLAAMNAWIDGLDGALLKIIERPA